MSAPRDFVLLVTLGLATTAPAVAQTSASIPDLSGLWNHASLNGLELPLSGPGPVRNKSRLTSGPQAGVGNNAQPVGDYTNRSAALGGGGRAQVRRDDARRSRLSDPTQSVLARAGALRLHQLRNADLQQPGKVTFLYPFDHQYRQVHLDEPHPAQVKPSWYGNSVGHYEGDTLVVDTIGLKVGPFSMIDLVRDAVHASASRGRAVPAHRLRGCKEALARDAKEHFQSVNPDNGPAPDLTYRGKALQIEVTIEDAGAFTTPWSATLTLRRARDERLELVCAENPQWYPGAEFAVPRAEKPDF